MLHDLIASTANGPVRDSSGHFGVSRAAVVRCSVGAFPRVVHALVWLCLMTCGDLSPAIGQSTTSRFSGAGFSDSPGRGGLYFGRSSGIYFGESRLADPRGAAGGGRTGTSRDFGGMGGGLLAGGGQDLLAAATVNSLLNGNAGANSMGFDRNGGYLGDSWRMRSGFASRMDRRRRDVGWQRPPIQYDTQFRIGFAAPSVNAGQLQTNLQQTLQRARLGTVAPHVTVRVETLGPREGSATVAVLQGTVATDEDRSVIEHLVRMQPGVTRVQNLLELSAPEIR